MLKKIFTIFLSWCIFSINAFADFTTEFIVQPYSNTTFYANTKKIIPTIIYSDNSLAKIKLNLPDDINNLQIEHQGYKTIELNKTHLLQKNNFIVLQKTSSQYKTIKAFNCGSQPKSVLFVNPNTVAMALLDENGIDIINIDTGEKKRISPPKKYANQLGFVELLLLQHKNELWVSQMTTGCIHVFDSTSFAYKATIQSTGTWSKVMAYNSITNKVYLSNWTSHNISIINPDNKIEESKIYTGSVPRGIAFSQDGKFIYCAQFEDANGNFTCRLLKKKLSDFKTILENGAKGAKRHIVVDYKKAKLYVSDMYNSTVEIYSTTTDKLLATVKVFSNPNTIKLSPDGSRLYVSCRGPNHPQKGYLHKGLVMGQLHIIDTTTFQTIETIECGNQPTGLDISPDGKKIVVSDFLDKRIRIIEFQN